ncbi:hypothetical protein HA052_19735 [Chromobacterium haemolyticum]|uniref:Transposase n=1 Tax=Chromobacterium fluminis TaxID=3044269 RepID=A0ABX0L913_9NEIS|nr:hypothetical protein [Chromobacterium haemolyticum]NHR07426.1 hypothetical protein [Chromobacterium haemolyticum]
MNARIHAIYRKAVQRNHVAYRKLFPLSMATWMIVGMAEYKARTERYERFAKHVLRWQKVLTASVTI